MCPWLGYGGKKLIVDLTTGKSTTQDISEDFARLWLGGRGFGAKTLFDEVEPGVRAFDPKNVLFVL